MTKQRRLNEKATFSKNAKNVTARLPGEEERDVASRNCFMTLGNNTNADIVVSRNVYSCTDQQAYR